MAESFLISAALAALNGLIPQAEQLISLGWGFDGDLRKLLQNLTTIYDRLSGAENQTAQSVTMKNWLTNLRPVISGAEYVLDELRYEAVRRKIGERNFLSLSNHLVFRLKMFGKVKHINFLFRRLLQQANNISLNLVIDGDIQHREFEPIHFDVREIFGRHRDRVILTDMLCGSEKEDDDLSVVTIVGMAGLGKTTLAQLIYNGEEVRRFFGGNMMWISVSDEFNVERVLQKMLQSLTGDLHTPNGYVERIVQRIGRELGERKYLLVLDDLWNTNANKWMDLKNCLLRIGGSKGSKILVTTRSMEVVLTMRTSPSLTHALTTLSRDDSWVLFSSIAFANGGPRETDTLLEIGRRIVEKCKGLPLAIQSVAHLLYSKRDEKEWRSIENNETWTSNLQANEILPVLKVSFDFLPSPSLKRCFALCSLYPKSSVIKKDELIQLWMTFGYLNPPLRSKLEMEDIGNDYFVALLHRSFFQNVEMDEYNNITSCKMHDALHDLAVHVSEGHRLTLEPKDRKSQLEVQHLSFDLWEETSLEFPKGDVERLRTLLPKIVVDCNCAIALSLYGEDIEKLPGSIRKLRRLRYLDLSETSIDKLPNFITKLYNLQTLKLPRDLIELPKDFHKLVSLKHYCMADTMETRKVMPMKIGLLTCLQTLPFFVVDEGSGRRIEELGSLSKLRGRLHVYDLQHVKDTEEATKAKISAKPHIQELGFRWDYKEEVKEETNTINHEDVLEGLEPHRNIQGLILENFGGRRFPSWMMNVAVPLLLNLVKIELKYCSLCEQVPPLGHLPNLKIIEMVRLDNLKRIGPEFYNDGGALAAVAFPALRKLTLDGMPMLEEWSLPALMSRTVFFPHLEELSISGCPQLIDIPGHLFSIQELTISSINLSNAESGKRCHPCLTICSNDWDTENMDILMEDLLEKSSKSLRNLTIMGLNELRFLPNKLWNLVSLEKLEMIKCCNLTSDIKGMEGFNGLTSLRQVSIKECKNLTSIPEGLLQETLVALELDGCPRLTTTELCSLTDLENLIIRGCPSLVSCWEDRLFSPTKLQRLEIGNFSKELQSFPWPFTSADASAAKANVGADILQCLQCGADIRHCLQCGNSLSHPSTSTSIAAAKQPQQFSFMSLRSLHLWGWEKLAHLPEGLQHLTTLRELSIHSFHLLQALPDWLTNISYLESLGLYSCKNLMSFPRERLAFLLYLTVEDCPHLRKRCQKGVGQEWRKIAHIPDVSITFSGRVYT